MNNQIPVKDVTPVKVHKPKKSQHDDHLNTLKLQIQQTRTQLASLPATSHQAPVRRIPPPPRQYEAISDAERNALKASIRAYLQGAPVDRFSLRSAPVF